MDTKVEIYSAMADNADWRIDRCSLGLPTEPFWSGEIPLPDADDETVLEFIFRMFNRVNESDCETLESIGYTLPSLSVGDEVSFNGKTFLCGRVGWEKVEGQPSVRWRR